MSGGFLSKAHLANRMEGESVNEQGAAREFARWNTSRAAGQVPPRIATF